jgi:predicted nucleic acid-binding protein
LIVVLDADVVIGALDASDAHHARTREYFDSWRSEGTQRLLSLVTLTEVLVAPAAQRERLAAAREAIAALEIVTHAPSEAIAVDAARLRGRHPISLPDAYALATARQVGGRLVSFDRTMMRAATEAGLSHGP